MNNLYKSVLLGLGLFAAFNASAVPAQKGVFQKTQPDGSVISVTLSGDEHFHRVFTADGLPLVYTEDKGYVYALAGSDGLPIASEVAARDPENRTAADKAFIATLNRNNIEKAFELQAKAAWSAPDSKLKTQNRRMSANSRGLGLCSTSFPRTGSPKGLVVLVEYSDVKFKMADPYDYFNRLLNEEGFSDSGATGSARDWFIKNSHGLFTPDFDLYGPITLPNRRAYYGRNTGVMNDDDKPYHMPVHALNILDESVDLSQYDCDGDGYIDNVYVFYAGQGEADGGPESSVWPHSWDLTVADARKSYVYDGVILDHYACSNEYAESSSYPDNFKPAGIGTFVHEFSHVLGLPDLYATTNSSNAFTPKEFSVLDHGPYNNDGRTPPNYSAFERYALDWMTPDKIRETGIHALEPIHVSNKAYIIPTKKKTEYYLLESRARFEGEYDFYLPGEGMFVWHVDFDQNVWDNNLVNNDGMHQYVDLIEADGIESIGTQEGDPFPGYTNVTEFSFNTTPALKSWAGEYLYVALSEIAYEPATGVTSFHAEFDTTAVNEIESETKQSIYSDGLNIYSGLAAEVFDITGRRVGFANDNSPFTAPAAGLYIVSTSEQSVKVMVR